MFSLHLPGVTDKEMQLWCSAMQRSIGLMGNSWLVALLMQATFDIFLTICMVHKL